MNASVFTYVAYIRTTSEKLWDALTQPSFTTQYWFGTTQNSTWKPGAAWNITFANGGLADSGSILEIDPPHRLVLAWRHEIDPDLTAEGYSQCTITLEPNGESVKLTIHHQMDLPESKYIAAVTTGWPMIVSSLKSLIETGTALPFDV